MAQKNGPVVDSSYVPAVNFKEQYERHLDVQPSDCDYIPSRYRNPDYAVLSDERIAYFAHWKECVAQGIKVETDIGYANLRVSEILCSDLPPVFKMKGLMGVYDALEDTGIDRKDISDAIFDLSIAEGLPLPFLPYGDG